MTVTLEPQEKVVIVEQHLKNILFAEYNIELSIKEATSTVTANETTVANLNLQLGEVQKQKFALESELEALNAEIKAQAMSIPVQS